MKLDLKHMEKESIERICREYQINVCMVELEGGRVIRVWCWDDDLDTLFDDSEIKVGSTYNVEKTFDFDEDYNPVGLDYNDYIETVELIQNGESYFIPVYCTFNGVGAENAIAIFERVVI